MARVRYRWAKIRGAYRLSRRNIARIVAAISAAMFWFHSATAALVKAIVWLKKDAMAILRSYGIAPPPDSGGIASGMPYLPGFEKMFLKSVG